MAYESELGRFDPLYRQNTAMEQHFGTFVLPDGRATTTTFRRNSRTELEKVVSTGLVYEAYEDLPTVSRACGGRGLDG